MTQTTLSERIQKVMGDLELDQPGFASLVGVTKGAVNQWLSGLTQSIGAEYAFALQRKANYSAEWVMFGTGPEMLLETYIKDPKIAAVAGCMQSMEEYKKDTLVKISNSLAEPDADARHGNNSG